MPRIIAALSIDAKMIYDRLAESKIGEIIGYDELSKIIGRDTTNGGRGPLTTARRKAMRENRMVFGTVRKQGIKRLADTEIVESAASDLRRIRKATRRVVERTTMVDFSKLPAKAQSEHNVYLSMFGAIAQMTLASSMKQIAKRVAETHQALPLAKTLEAFKEAAA